ncbi:unnamed protein product [Paramecium sonneborni]|uniref:Uncharacterized protein n=1 Tax=Paramecium sonneborni TaxID=65129 RepID=A0A8S1L658_9CILI|nr:unnamed protein product [Paramecium sonneborni]
MGVICGQIRKFKTQESYTSRPQTQSLKHEQENIEHEEQDQLFCPSLTKNYILNPRFLNIQEQKCEKEDYHQITQIEQNSSQISLGIQSELNNVNETQAKQKSQNKLKPNTQKRMSLEQSYKIALSPSLQKKRNSNTIKSPLAQMFQKQNHTAKQKEKLILMKGKQKIQDKDEQLE